MPRRAGGIVEFVPQVGDFVCTGEPLFELYGDAVSIATIACSRAVAFGPERTMEQDPLFAFRIIVGHRAQGSLAGDQRPDDRGTGTRPAASTPACHRSTPAARRHDCRPSRHAARHLPDTELGGLCRRRLHRDTCVWRQQRADCQAPPGDARQSDRHAARPSARSARWRTPSPRSGDRVALRAPGRPRTGGGSGYSGVGRIVGVPRARPAVMAAQASIA